MFSIQAWARLYEKDTLAKIPSLLFHFTHISPIHSQVIEYAFCLYFFWL